MINKIFFAGFIILSFLISAPKSIFAETPDEIMIKQLEDKNPIKRKEAIESLYKERDTPVFRFHEISTNLIISKLKELIEKEQIDSVKLEALYALIRLEPRSQLDRLAIFSQFLSSFDGRDIPLYETPKDLEIIQTVFNLMNETQNKNQTRNIFDILGKKIEEEQNSKRREKLILFLLLALEYDIHNFRAENSINILTKAISQDPDYYFRKMAVLDTIGKFKIKEGLDILLMGLKSSDAEIRDKAAFNIGLLADKRAVPGLIKSLEIYGLDEMHTVLTLGILNAKESLAIIIDKIKLLTNSSGSVRAEWVAAVIDKLDRRTGLNQLKSLLNHDNKYVRINAEKIIKKINERDFSEYLKMKLNK